MNSDPNQALRSVRPGNRGGSSASTADIMMVQEAMQSRGLYQGAIDGMPGKATQRAIRSYKKQHHIPVNNTLDDDFIDHVRREV